jgi:hypothetical protein
MPRLLRRRAFVALAACGVLAAACGNAAESGVNVKTVATDLTYGVPGSPKPAPPANTDTTPDDPIDLIKHPGEQPKEITPPKGPVDPCPETPPNLFPPPQPSTIRGNPRNGTYNWRVSGTQMVPAVGKVRLAPSTLRTVAGSTTQSGGPRFTIEERELIFGSQHTVRTTYEWRAGTIDEEERGINVDRSGLYLVKIERIHRTNEASNSEFNPSPAIMIMPSPITIGSSVTSAGVDPVSFEVLRQTGTYTKRQRVDACGKPMDTFYAETFRDFVSADGTTTRIKYDFGLSTTMGGMIIVEHIESPCVDSGGACAKEAVTFTMDTHIGQLEPN